MDITHATPELFAAMAAAQGEIENASKNASNPHFKSKYADLAEVLNTTRPVFAKHGLSLLQSTAFDGSLVNVTTVIAHATGGCITSIASCAPAKTDAQGIGAATTYLRRYGAAAMGGIAQEDDDGNAAAHDRKPEPVASKPAIAEPSELQIAAAFDFQTSIAQAIDLTNLDRIAAELAKSNLPEGLRDGLRAKFSSKRKELAKAA